MILVLGAGVAGLAAAETLRRAGREFLVLEKEDAPGGWCRSSLVGGYRFDMSGHFLHTADPVLRTELQALPGLGWSKVTRRARVFLEGRLTPFPFQVNLHGHDAALVGRCLKDFAAERIREALSGSAPPANLAEWFERRFGAAMCRAFFSPYNRKMWRRPLSSMTYEWTDWSVPVPTFDEVLAGARGEGRRDGGYNATFLYPRRGGIGALPAAMAVPLSGRVRTRAEALSIDLRHKTVTTSAGDTIPFSALISTIPLPELARRSRGGAASIGEAGRRLSWIKVLALNVGVRHPGRFDGHWHYVPGGDFPFFRVGCLSNVSPRVAPKGCASYFAEKSFRAGSRLDVEKETGAMLDGLARLGAIGSRSVVEAVSPVVLDPGYVVFDRARQEAVPRLRSAFARRGVFTAGRYGAWDYFGMEKSIADGRRAAKEAASFRG
ncbi:MAG TPA: FAD-dependent oxidoreductase [Candidatus Deferrimicrobiaceae bacterium]|jgi:protoporphyrinogen oxidase